MFISELLSSAGYLCNINKRVKNITNYPSASSHESLLIIWSISDIDLSQISTHKPLMIITNEETAQKLLSHTQGCPHIMIVHNPRLALARICNVFYRLKPALKLAVTGTEGKSSVASFVKQTWGLLGRPAASIGTLGIETSIDVTLSSSTQGLTTPGPIAIHQMFEELVSVGIESVILEASSHGLAQYRLHNIDFTAVAIIGVNHDHLDYHKTIEEYARAKLMLLEEILQPNRTVVLNTDNWIITRATQIAKQQSNPIITYGLYNNSDITIEKYFYTKDGYDVTINIFGTLYDVFIPLLGRFQISNLMCAIGLIIASGGTPNECIEHIYKLCAPKGRLEKIKSFPNNGTVFIDYAHKPEAFRSLLLSLRDMHYKRIILVFGCGGDRDPHKRSVMGRIAHELSDIVIITDDNPRSEDPSAIRKSILAGCPNAFDIADRIEAITFAVSQSQKNDVVIIAGKGRDIGQIYKDTTVALCDKSIVESIPM